MQLSRHLKPLIGFGITLVVLVILAIILIITESGLSVWTQLQETPSWFFYVYIGVIAIFTCGSGWLVWPRKKITPVITKPIPTEDEIQSRVTQATNTGMDVTVAQRELENLAKRRSSGEIYVATFGEISAEALLLSPP